MYAMPPLWSPGPYTLCPHVHTITPCIPWYSMVSIWGHMVSRWCHPRGGGLVIWGGSMDLGSGPPGSGGVACQKKYE